MGNYILEEAFKELRDIDCDIVKKPNTTKVLGKKVVENKKASKLTQKSTLNEKLDENTNKVLNEENRVQKTSEKTIVENVKPCDVLLSLKKLPVKLESVQDSTNVCIRRKLQEDKINLLNDKDIEKGKEILNQEEDKTIEKIVDVNADVVDNLKKSYVGDLILQCNICKTLVYKGQEDLVQDENDKELYNIEDECPHCGSKDGYKLIGQVSAIDSQDSQEIEKEQEEEIEGTKETEEVKTDDKNEIVKKEKKVELEPVKVEEEEKEETFEGLDKKSFNQLICNYGNKIYENFSNYEVSKITTNENNIIVEGVITFKNNKSKNITFNLDRRDINESKCKLIGNCKDFTNNDRAFIFNCNVNNNKVVCENLSYRYIATNKLNESVKVVGKVIL